MKIIIWTKRRAKRVWNAGPCRRYCNYAGCNQCYDYETACRILNKEM